MADGGKQGTDQTVLFITLVAAVVVIALIAWNFGHDYIVRIFFGWRHFEMYIAVPVAVFVDKALLLMHLGAHSQLAKIQLWQQLVTTMPANAVSANDLLALSNVVGHYIAYLSVVVLGSMAAYCYFFHRSAKFLQVYNMDSLREAEVQHWPQISSVVKLNLIKTDIDDGPWAMAQLPLNFCKKHDLVKKPEKHDDTTWIFNTIKAQSVFTMQMGPLFRSPVALPSYMQALFVIFCARASGKKDQADRLLDQISKSAGKGGALNFSGVREQMIPLFKLRLVGWLAGRHAYVYTYMASLLDIARSDGVLATSEFLWLKPLDRRLWFVLNTVGRNTAVIEVAGPYAHWRAENRLKVAMRVPMVQQAVKGAEIAVSEILFERAEDQWRSAG